MDSQINYLPTGTCFDDTFDLIQSGFFERKELGKIRIVHALVERVNPVEDEPQKPYAHAWVEFEGVVHEVFIHAETYQKIVMLFTQEQHATVIKTVSRTEYTLQEVGIAGMLDPLKSSGPYKLEYLRACRDWEDVKHLYDFEGAGV